MYYLQLNNNQVMQIIPEYDPVFPGIPITERYSSAFISECIKRENVDDIHCGMIYDQNTDTFSEPHIQKGDESND